MPNEEIITLPGDPEPQKPEALLPPAEPKQPEHSGFDPVKTANVLARQSKESAMDAINLLAAKKPEWFIDPDARLDPAKPADNGKPAIPQNQDVNGRLEGELQRLKKDNWTKDAIMEFGLDRSDRDFIRGESETEIRDSAARLAERYNAMRKPGETPNLNPPLPGETPKLPNEQPSTYGRRPETGSKLTPDEARAGLQAAEANGELNALFGGH